MQSSGKSTVAGRLASRGLVFVLLLLAGVAAFAAPAFAERVIHVDFEAGDDARDGLTPATARKTAPPAEMIRPGVRILFKGGAVYGASVKIQVGGAPDAPVIYDGNSRGEWGEGPAIFDGSRPLGPWTRAGETADGLAIWETPLPPWFKWVRDDETLWIFQDGRLGRLTSSADAEDNWTEGQYAFFNTVPRAQATETSITQPEVLSRYSDAWDEARILLHYGNNHLKAFEVTGFDRAAGAVTFERAQLIRSGDPHYAVINHPDDFDAPGELLVRGETLRYIPFDGVDPNAADIRMPLIHSAIYNDEADHVVVRGFRMTMHRAFAIRFGNPRQGWRGKGAVIEDNDIEIGGGIVLARQDNAVVRGNQVVRPLSTQPIFVRGSDQVRVEDNAVREGLTGLTFYGVTNSLIKNNDSRSPRGVHGNALTLYEGSHNTWLVGNRLSAGQAGTSITLRESDDLLIAFNEVAPSRWSIIQWAETKPGDSLGIYNNTLTGTVRLQKATIPRTTFRNNILGKFEIWGGLEDFAARDHNLYGDRLTQATVAPANFRAGEALAKLYQAVVSMKDIDMRPTELGATLLDRGLPLAIAGVEVRHIGAIPPDGRRLDLSAIGLPPRDPAIAANRP